MKHQSTTKKTSKKATFSPAKSNLSEERMINLFSRLESVGIDPIALKEFINADRIPAKLLTQKAKENRSKDSLNRLFSNAMLSTMKYSYRNKVNA